MYIHYVGQPENIKVKCWNLIDDKALKNYNQDMCHNLIDDVDPDSRAQKHANIKLTI